MQEKMDTSDAGGEQPPLVNANRFAKMSPTRLVNELASEVQRQYRPVDESRPPRKVPFTVVLKIDSEEYTSSERSFMTVQSATDAKAMNKTPLEDRLYENHKLRALPPIAPPTGHATAKFPPPERPHLEEPKAARITPFKRFPEENHELNAMRPLSPIDELNDLACQRLQRPLYLLMKPPQRPKGTARTQHVFLTVFKKQFRAEGRTEMEAKIAAAVEALNSFSTTEYMNQPEAQNVPEIMKESTEGDVVENPVALEHQADRKTDLGDNFVATQDSGLPNKGTSPSKCIFGEATTQGDGIAEKVSKKIAAWEMLEEKKNLPYLPPPNNKEIEMSTKTDGNLAKMGTVGDMPIDDSGPSKSTSTNDEAEAMLQRMDSSRTQATNAQSSGTSRQSGPETDSDSED